MTTTLPNWLLLSTLLLGACWLFYHLLLRRERSWQFNRGLLLLAPLLAAVLPLLPLPTDWLVATRLPDLAAAGRLPSVWLPEVQATATPADAGWPAWPWLLYGAGVLLGLLLQAARLLRLWQLTRRLPRQTAAGYVLRPTGGRLPTSSFGRQVFWDETAPLSPTEAAQMLRHELAHVQQGHSADRLWLGCWQAVLWFNPFVHLCARALSCTHEYLADAAAAPATAPAPYAALLARQALSRFTAPALAHSFSTSQTLTRIAMLHHQTPVRRWKQWLVLPLTGLLLSVAACEKAEQLAATPPPPPPPAPEAPTAPAGRVLEIADEMPEYQGGMEQLMQDLSTLVKYPEAAKKDKLEGKVFVGFVVAADGSMQDVKIRKGISHPLTYPGQDGKPVTTTISTPADQALDQAALRAVQALPGRWTPGRQDGKPVAVAYTIPITFALN
ncbi:energy transducer TonB [Hymenobacter gummosus]|nr:M56 family metallopeptidase [Hymenobacter gummosus]